MAAELQNLSPTEVLATRIVDALQNAKLVPAAKQEVLLAKLQGGRITAQDWRELLELGLPTFTGERL